jgi:hypothetical protein
MTEVLVPDYDAIEVRQLDFDEPAQVNRSAWTGARKVVGLPGAALWRGGIEIKDIATELEERQWRSFLAKLKGVQNWFKVYLPCQVHIGPAPSVAAGATDGYTLPLTGMQPEAIILYAGQHMTVPLPSGHSRAVRLTADLLTDASGNATAEFAPALNEIPTLGVAVETAKPFVPVTSATARLGLSYDNGVSAISFEIEESR